MFSESYKIFKKSNGKIPMWYKHFLEKFSLKSISLPVGKCVDFLFRFQDLVNDS